MHTLEVDLFKPSNWFGRLISLVTGSPYCHAGICLDLEYWEALNDGVHHDPLPRKDIAWHWGTTLDAQQYFAAHRFLMQETGTRYSWTTILADLWNRFFPWARLVFYIEGQYVCSALVAETLNKAGVREIDEPHAQSPGDLGVMLGAVTHAPGS